MNSGFTTMGEVIEGMAWPGEDKPKKDLTATAEKCCGCGTLVSFTGNQWRRACPQCGIYITLTNRYKPPERPIECYACLDTGIVTYQAQVDGEIYDYAARCICRAGTNRPEKAIQTIDRAPNAPRYETIVARNMTKMRRAVNE